MYQIDSAGNVSGQWSNGNPAIPTPGTILDATWMNMLQAELLAILTAASISPVKGTNNQVLTALQALFLKSGTPTLNGPSYAANWGNPSAGFAQVSAYRTADNQFRVYGFAQTTGSLSMSAATPVNVATFGIAPAGVSLYGVATDINNSANGGGSYFCYIDTSGVLHFETNGAVTIANGSFVNFAIQGIG